MLKKITTTILIILITMVGTAEKTLAAPGLSDLLLEASSHNSTTTDDLICTYSLTEANTAAVAWYKNSNPIMEFYLPFEGSVTSSQLDFSGNGNSVTNVGSPVWEPTGGPNGSGAYLFSSTNRFEAEVFPTLSSYTKVAWVQMTDLASSHNILSSGSATGGHTFWASQSQGNRLSAGQAGMWVIAQDPTPLVTHQWYFVAVTFDYTTGEMILFKDNQIVDNVTVLSGNRDITDATLQVGTFSNGSGWKGRIAEAQIYDFVLSPEQILALYNGSDTIKSTETIIGEQWHADVTPFSNTEVGATITTNTLTITVDPPVVSNIPNQTISEGLAFTTISLDNYVADLNHTDIEITWTYSGNVTLSVDITDQVATITTLGTEWNGVETITFRATDPDGLWNEDVATFTVTAVNDPPIVSDIPDQTIAEGGVFVSINLDDYVDDVDNVDADMIWTYSGNVILSVDITDRVATITTLGTEWNGVETITFRATDPDGLWNEDAATFTVTAVNDPPVVSDIPNQIIAEGGTFATINLDDYVDDVDNIDTDITWTYSGNITLTIDITDRVATITTLGLEWSGSEIITFRATDTGSLWSEDAATFTVTIVNDPPIVSDIPDQTIAEGGVFATINLDDYVDDIDNIDTDITWTYSGTVALSVDITERVATITMPSPEWNGFETIIFRATDLGSLWDEDVAMFTVTADNDPPVLLSNIPDQLVEQGFSFTPIDLDNYVSDIDNDLNEMSWTYSGEINLLITIDDFSHTATIDLFSSLWYGTETITFRCTDPGGLFVEDNVTFTVDADPGVESVILLAASINPLTTDDLFCSYTLTGNPTTAALSWYLNSSPVAKLYMPIEGGPDNALLDMSGNNITVTPIGSAANAWRETDGHDSTGAFNFGSSFHIIAGECFPTSSSYTKVAWVNRKGSGSNNILSSEEISGGHVLYASGTQNFHLSAGQNGNWNIVQDLVPLDTGLWYHTAVTFDYASGQMNLYKNGVLVDADIVPIDKRDITDATLLIGAFANSSQWNGLIDEAYIYASALSPEQIMALYNGTDTLRFTETDKLDQWRVEVTPFAGLEIGPTVSSNTLLVGYVNQPPLLSDIPPQTVDVGRYLTFTATATDPDPQPLPALNTSTLPLGALFTDLGNGSGKFEWTPDYNQFGDFPVTIYAVDDSTTVDSQAVVITVIPDTTTPTLALISPTNDSITTDPFMLLGMDVTDINPMVLMVYGGTAADTTNLIYVQENISSSTEYFEWSVPVLKPDVESTVGLWHLDDYGTESIIDESMNENNGQLFGNLSWSSEGSLGYALEFDGIDGYAEISDHPSLDIDPMTGAVTLEAWINPDISGDGQLRSIMAKRAYGKSARTVNYEMLLNFDRKLMFAAGDESSYIYLSSVILPAGQWSYVAITLDAVEQTAFFYLNGILADSIVDVPFGPTHNEPLYVGAAGPNSEPFVGQIDEIRISNRILEPSEIQSTQTLNHGEYYWWAQVTDASGNSDTSEIRHFIVNLPEPQPPELITPPTSSDSILYNMIPTFSWTPWIYPISYDTIYYRLHVAKRNDFSQQTVIDSIMAESFTWIDSLNFDQQFWWKVDGWVNTDSGLFTVSSNVHSFYSWTLGDVNHSHDVGISDLTYIVEYLFQNGDPIFPLFTGDLNGSCDFGISDLTYLVEFLFGGGPAPKIGCD